MLADGKPRESGRAQGGRRLAPALVVTRALTGTAVCVGLLGFMAAGARAQAPGSARMVPMAVVSSEKDHALTLVDLGTQSVVGTIATCKRPRHMKVMPSGRELLAACGDSGQADLVDLTARKSLRRFRLGDDPEIFDLSADGRTLYVSNEEDAKVGIIDVNSGKAVAEIKVGEEPEGVILSRDGKTLYVTSEVAGMVHVVDVGTRKVVKDIAVGKRPRRLAFAQDGAQLWVSNELDASVSVIDTRSQQVTATVRFELKGARSSDITPVGLMPSPDGRTMFVALGHANHVAFVDVATRQTRQMVLVGKRAWSMATDKTGQRLYVVNGLSDDLTIVDVATAKALKTIKVGRVPHSVVLVEP